MTRKQAQDGEALRLQLQRLENALVMIPNVIKEIHMSGYYWRDHLKECGELLGHIPSESRKWILGALLAELDKEKHRVAKELEDL